MVAHRQRSVWNLGVSCRIWVQGLQVLNQHAPASKTLFQCPSCLALYKLWLQAGSTLLQGGISVLSWLPWCLSSIWWVSMLLALLCWNLSSCIAALVMVTMMILQKAKYMHRLARKMLYQALQIVCIFASLNHQPSSCLHHQSACSWEVEHPEYCSFHR